MHIIHAFAHPKLQRLFGSLLLALAVLSGAASTAAAQQQYRIRSWTTGDGLPQNTVNSIVQTGDGYLWLATFGGLVRFDGVRFKVFNTVNAPALKSSRVTALHEDRSGILWAATETGEISCLRDGEFHPFDDGETEEINSLYADTGGYLWAGGWSGARRYRLLENRCGDSPVHEFERIKAPLSDGQASPQISTIVETDGGDIWLNNFGVNRDKPARLLRWRAGQPLEVWDVSADLNQATGFGTQEIYNSDIALAGSGANQTLWAADRSGLRRFDGQRFIKEFAFPENKNDRVKFARAADGRLIADSSGGIARLNDAGNWEFTAADLRASDARAFFCDRENNLWLGTNTAGLLRLKPNTVEFFDESSGVAKNQTAAVLEDSRGRLWIAGYGLRQFENDKFVPAENVPASYLLSLAELRDGTLLIGGYDRLFARRADGSVIDLSRDISAVVGSATFAVKAIFEDSRGDLWLGFRDKGLLCRDANGNYTRFTTENGLVGNQIQFITEAKNGALWFAALGGASRFENGRFTNLTAADGFANDNIRAIVETADGTVYFGTYGGGLSRLKNGAIQTATTQNGLFDDVVSRIIVDGDDNFWMLGNQGAFTANRREIDRFFDGASPTIFCRSFGAADGMLTPEGNGGSQPAGWLAGDGRFWFPTIRGYAAITPGAPDKFLPPAAIEEIKIDNKVINARAPVVINPGEQNLEIRYTGLSFNRSDEIRFRYKLEGYDRDWTEAGTRRTAYYAYPPAGEYVFAVQAANSDGVWNEESAKLQLKILPPFYRTWWFYALAFFGLMAAGYSIYSYRVMQLNRARQTQEVFSRRLIQLQEEERKRIAGDLHDSLSQNLVIIKNRAMLSLSERDDIESVFEQIEEIAEAAQESLTEVRQIAANLRPFQIDRLGLTKAVEALVRKASSANLSVAALVENIDNLLEPEMEINLYRIVQESLNNVIKHSGASRASVEIKRQAKTISVTIRDNGKGFDFYGIHRTEQPMDGGGFGLLGIRERARILGAIPVVESSAGNGTTIRLIVSIK